MPPLDTNDTLGSSASIDYAPDVLVPSVPEDPRTQKRARSLSRYSGVLAPPMTHLLFPAGSGSEARARAWARRGDSFAAPFNAMEAVETWLAPVASSLAASPEPPRRVSEDTRGRMRARSFSRCLRFL